MSDTKLDPRSLSAEEEAILDACFRGNIHDLGSAIVCYGRALFGQGASEAADPMASWGVWRCECCAAVANPADSAFRWNGDCWQHHHAEAQTHFDCQFFGPCPRQRPEPAQPEPKPEPAATDVFATDRAIGVQAMNAEDVPAATEMPEAVRKVCHRLRHLAMTSAIACRIGDRDEFDEYAAALESWWRTHAQPVANVANVGMTEELEVVLRLAAQHVEGWQQTYQSPEYRKQMLSAIAAVRQQAAQVQRPKLEFPAVRLLVSKIRDWQSCAELTMHPSKLDELCFAALAEVDAAQGRK